MIITFGTVGRPFLTKKRKNMDIIKFINADFKYPESEIKILDNYSAALPEGVITLLGQNGTGKSTLLLLAAGLMRPVKGDVLIFGKNSRDLKDMKERQKFVSFIYQNMEFENEEKIGDLMNFVYQNGLYENKNDALIKELIERFELEKILLRRMQEISKGELQRAIIAFSLLYGSKVIMMDEPFFALEEYQKDRSMAYLTEFSHKHNISIYYSAHDIDMSFKYSDYALLFYPDKNPEFGASGDMLKREKIEKAYEVPFTLLRSKEKTFRQTLNEVSELKP